MKRDREINEYEAIVAKVEHKLKIVEQHQQYVEQLEATLRKRKAVVNAICRYLTGKSTEKPLPPDTDEESIFLWDTVWDAQTLERAQRNRDNTFEELKLATQNYHRANDELNRAKDELKAQPLSRQELDLFINAFIAESEQHFHTRQPVTFDIKERIDTGDVQDQLSNIVNEVDKQKGKTTLQGTKAAVLIGTSGVGKTFTALTYPSRDKADATKAYVNIYVGLNNDCELTGPEDTFIKDATDQDRAVETVILGRLIACLAVLRKEGYPDRPADSDVHSFVPKVSSDSLICMIRDSGRKYDSGLAVREAAVQLLSDLQQVKGKPTVVLINVDEAQKLDKFTHGARYALRCLRHLQYAVVNATAGRCVPLGLATGINPECSLDTFTDGENVFIEGTIMTEKDFEELAMRYTDQHSEEKCRSLAVLCYPRVRMLIGLLIGCSYFPNGNTDKTECLNLLDHFIRNEPLPLKKIPQWCVNWGIKHSVNNLRVVQIDYPIWKILLQGIDTSIPETVMQPVEIIPKVERGYFVEGAFGTILYAILYLLFCPVQGLENAATYYRCNEGTALQAALGLQPQEHVSIQLYQGSPNDAKQNYHPFPHDRSHSTAIQSGKLSDGFKAAVATLKAVDKSVLFLCGGSAPIDYLHVRRSNTNGLVVWYADCKSHVKNKKAESKFSQLLSEARDVAKKALQVHWGLLHLQPESQTVTGFSSQYTVSVLTNVMLSSEEIEKIRRQTRLPVDLAQLQSVGFKALPDRFSERDDEPRTPGVIVLCPTNFMFKPLSSVLYRAADEKAFYGASKSGSI